jgi:hypothetical protein
MHERLDIFGIEYNMVHHGFHAEPPTLLGGCVSLTLLGGVA